MTFAVTLYLSVEAASEDEAREIVESIGLKSKYNERILWNSLFTEMEEIPVR